MINTFCVLQEIYKYSKPKQIYIFSNKTELNKLEQQFSALNKIFLQEKIIYFLDENNFQQKQQRDQNIYEYILKIQNSPAPILITLDFILQELPTLQDIKQSSFYLTDSQLIKPKELMTKLVQLGYENEYQVQIPGEFSLRGNILDIFSPFYSEPCRIEFFGDEIDSIKMFDPISQRSNKKRITEILISPQELKCSTNLLEIIVHEMDYKIFTYQKNILDEEIATQTDKEQTTVKKHLNALNILTSYSLTSDLFIQYNKDNTSYIIEKNIHILNEQILNWQKEHYTIYISSIKNISNKILAKKINTTNINLITSHLQVGIIDHYKKIVIINSNEIFARETSPTQKKYHKYNVQKILEREPELEIGEYVIHLFHGIAIYRGIQIVSDKEFIILEFDEEKKLHLPIHNIHLVQKYISYKKAHIKLNKLSQKKLWNKKLFSTINNIQDIATTLLNNAVNRKHQDGFEFSSDNELQKEFELSFPYKETPGQNKALEEIKQDMQSKKPMDRLLCGDVGFGKTELIMRACFKAVLDNKQVAIIVPTTILCQQHYNSFSKRMAEFPINIEMICRFVPKKKQQEILDKLKFSGIDIIIGTHRLLQADITFKNLGIIVIDEEQRFGVAAKEQLKQVRQTIDIISVSATPIPRTLYMSISGIKQLSVIDTPPSTRKAIKTFVEKDNINTIKIAIEKELKRNGQVLFIHNRIKSIENLTEKIAEIFPKAHIRFAHGKIQKNELEDIMYRFSQGTIDILISTTIVESGIDIPQANTIIIQNSQNFSIAQLHQLRGRVGRHYKQAYCYLLTPPHKIISEIARKRLSSLKLHSNLGAGFTLALKDMELRGIGAILSKEQSGHVDSIGYTLFCKILEKSIDNIKQGKKRFSQSSTNIQIDFMNFSNLQEKNKIDAYIKKDYIENDEIRINIYKKLNLCKNNAQIIQLKDEIQDRFGNIPMETINLIHYYKLQAIAKDKNITNISNNKDLYFINQKKYIFHKQNFQDKLQEIILSVNQYKE